MVGVVVVNKFCKPGDKSGVFRGYIDYIDREEATRNKNTDRYNLFQNYMGNPEKTHALFTKTKDNLTAEEKEVLKDAFSQAYDNGSLLWQTVVSFDNQWLEQNGLYNRTTHILDEPKLNEITRLAVSKMLEKENMDHALWSAAIHHNTDNIHIHIAITEITPMREKKEFTEYKFVKEKEKYVNEKGYEDFRIVKKKVPVLDEKGNPQTYTEYRGKFQQSSLAVLKRTYVNEIINEREINEEINRVIREVMIQSVRDNPLVKDRELVNDFIALCSHMPECNKNMWNYNNSIMANVRFEVDMMTKKIIDKYHGEDMKKLDEILIKQSDNYKAAYGGMSKDYRTGKLNDLYSRMGNAVLGQVRGYCIRQERLNKDTSISEKSAYKKANYSLEMAWKKLIKSMNNEFDQWRNMEVYKELTQDQESDYNRK